MVETAPNSNTFYNVGREPIDFLLLDKRKVRDRGKTDVPTTRMVCRT